MRSFISSIGNLGVAASLRLAAIFATPAMGAPVPPRVPLLGEGSVAYEPIPAGKIRPAPVEKVAVETEDPMKDMYNYR